MIIDKEKQSIAGIIELCPLAERDILEVGCGDGRLSVDIAAACGSFTAIDPDPPSIAVARERIPAGNFHIGMGEQLPFSNHCFDVAIFTLSLHHHQLVQKALKESIRVLRPGGNVIVIEPDAESEISTISAIFNDETDVLQKTLEHMDSFPLACIKRSQKEVLWICSDVDSLYDWLINHYNTSRSNDTRQQLLEFLGPKSSSSPLTLQERLHFSLFQEGAVRR